MNDKQLTQLSRFLSLVLRHKPETIDMILDRNGWADVDLLIDGVNRSGRHITQEVLNEIVAKDEKQRYVFSHDKKMIRASQGHSIDVDLELKPVEPPEFLYHGTAHSFLEGIQRKGLQPRQRQYVHLSSNIETAIHVGSRHGKPIVLTVFAKQLYESGQTFFLSENNVWLTTHVEPIYLQISQTNN
jgi:putative RNA 2'-phosphotransferase